VLAHAEVHEVLIEAAIPDRCSDGDRPYGSRRHDEGVTHELRTPGLDGVVVSDDAIIPDLMQIVEATIDVDETIGEAVSAFLEIAARLDESALMQDLSGCIFDGELDP